jgi:integrase
MPRSKSTPPSDGLRRGEGFITETVRADGSIRYQARWYERQVDGTWWLASRSFNDRDRAEDHLHQVYRDKRDGRYVSATDITVQRAIEDYLERGESGWKPITYATYKQRAETHIIPALGSIRLVELTTARVQHWIDSLNRRRKADPSSVPSPKTVEEATRLLSSAMKDAVRLDIIRTNPVTGVRLPKAAPVKHVTWSAEEMARVLSFVAEDVETDEDWKWPALYRVMLMTGMRPGELRALTWKDIDLDARIATVRHTITRDADNREVLGTSTKTGTDRAIALPASAVMALRAWKVRQARIQLAADRWDPSGFIFTGRRGQFLGGTTWQKRHARIIAGAHVTSIGLHEMRHTNATVELAAGTHPKIVSDRLGHAKIETTLNLYSHVSPDLQRSAIDALEARINGASNTTTSG